MYLMILMESFISGNDFVKMINIYIFFFFNLYEGKK